MSGDYILETPLSITQYSSTAPKPLKMTIKLNEHFSETVNFMIVGFIAGLLFIYLFKHLIKWQRIVF